MSDRHEARLLLAVLRRRWDEAEAIVRRRPPHAGTFASLCRACDVHPTVHAILERAERFDLVGADARGSLESMRRKTRHDNLLLLAVLEQALDLLLAEGIVPVALKGVDFVHRFGYGFDERAVDDVDLLVRPAERDRAIAALSRAGWTLPPESELPRWLHASFEIPLTSPGPVGVTLEIHWSLGQERRYGVDPETIVAAARPLIVAGRPVLGLDPSDAVAHLLIHHVQHYFDRRLKWALDLLRLIALPEFSWEATAGRLRAWRGAGAAGLALAHLRRIFPDEIPPEAAHRLPAAAWRLVATAPLRSGHPLDFYRATRRRWVQLWIAAACLEDPRALPGYWVHRGRRLKGAGPDPR